MWIRRGKETGTVVCIASHVDNLHNSYGDQLGLIEDYDDLEVSAYKNVGDVFKGSKWTSKPENYPQPSEEEVREAKINERIQKNARDAAEAELIEEGKIEARHTQAEPKTYGEMIVQAEIISPVLLAAIGIGYILNVLFGKKGARK